MASFLTLVCQTQCGEPFIDIARVFGYTQTSWPAFADYAPGRKPPPREEQWARRCCCMLVELYARLYDCLGNLGSHPTQFYIARRADAECAHPDCDGGICLVHEDLLGHLPPIECGDSKLRRRWQPRDGEHARFRLGPALSGGRVIQPQMEEGVLAPCHQCRAGAPTTRVGGALCLELAEVGHIQGVDVVSEPLDSEGSSAAKFAPLGPPQDLLVVGHPRLHDRLRVADMHAERPAPPEAIHRLRPRERAPALGNVSLVLDLVPDERLDAVTAMHELGRPLLVTLQRDVGDPRS
mmetsp:Transcript_41171/g.87870  ORF Transcript_41171/g.87870 Transcript_41171/m.87870 type:complete len:294 (+) Transcript_41171:89-970(+)